MASKFKAFMLEELKKDEIITFPGVETFKDETGKVIDFQIKKLSTEEIQKIRSSYRSKKVATDKKGKPLITGNSVVYAEDYDAEKAGAHIMVEAFVVPDMHDKELMEFYGCVDVTEMPKKLFRKYEDYQYANECVLQALDMIDKPDEEQVDDLKN